MNYEELNIALQQTTENLESSFVESIPRFVKQAEQRVYNAVLFNALRKPSTGLLTPGNRFLPCPSDFLASFSLAVIDATGAYEFLLPKDPSFIRTAYPNPNDLGVPRFYATYGPRSDDPREMTFLLGPTPAQEFAVELDYFYYPPSIVENSNSWLGDNFDSVLLYGALVQAAIFMKAEADIVAAYDAQFKEALALAKRLGDGMERGDTYRSGEPRVPVE